MYAAAPRLDPRLLRALVRLDDETVAIAETYRRSRDQAANLDLPRPSYECLRILIHEARRERARHRANRATLIRVALYRESIDELNRLE